jgi:hypothetical protein
MLIVCPDSKTLLKLVPIARNIIGTVSRTDFIMENLSTNQFQFYTTFDTQTAANLLIQCIRSLMVNGADESCLNPLLSLTFMVYAWLRPIYPALFDVLKEVPDLTIEVLNDFDAKVLTFVQNNEKFNDKQRKQLMGKILKSVIAVSSRFGNE